jgi:hypothetical protein
MTGYDPATDASMAKQWTRASNASTWRPESEFSIGDAIETVRHSVYIYLVLDASTSLRVTDPNISADQYHYIRQIRTAINKFIDTLYDRLYPNSN